MTAEPDPGALAADLVAWARGRPWDESDEPPVWRWERWIRDDPERAWEVFLHLASRGATELEVMERVAQRLPLLLHTHWDAFHDRALGLVRSTPMLDRMVGPEVFTREHYGARYRDLDELAAVWVTHDAVGSASHRVTDIVRSDPETGLRLALEIVRRGPLHGLEEWDLHAPLLELLRCHGAAVIGDIEADARTSEALRRVIWDSRRLDPGPRGEFGIERAVWERWMRAAGTTTTHNSPRPAGSRTALGDEDDLLLDHWFDAQRTRWAWSEVGDLVREDFEQGWLVVGALLRHATEAQAQCDIGCGPLEDLIRAHPAELIDRIERRAAEDERFRFALGCVWITLEDVPEPFARRYWEASGRQISVLGSEQLGPP